MNPILKKITLSLLLASAVSTSASATAAPRGSYGGINDGAFLDRPYHHPRKTIDMQGRSELVARKRSDIEKVIALQSPVKSQASRGTCSIFSATSYIESFAIAKGALNSDLSEEFLEYLVMNGRNEDGSSSPNNLRFAVRMGLPAEELMPYIGETWKSPSDSALAQQRCGAVPKTVLQSCLLGHRDPRLASQSASMLAKTDPELLKAKDDAEAFRVRYLSRMSDVQYLYTSDLVKKSLITGGAVLLDLDFYYGTWNHRKAADLGIGRDTDAWDKGILGYPETGSMDILASRKEPAGHSVLVVGYDDDLEITTRVKMSDGSVRDFKYKGVYIFKNSWGTATFGRAFTYRGKTYPGYGMMPQKYAHEYGTFFRITSL